MPRQARTRGESDIYHIVVRGSGRQIIFEDDTDRESFLDLLSKQLDNSYELLAWCLMGNHVHLLIRAPIEAVSLNMKNLSAEYARRFNRRHGRVGHLFQGRFRSEPVDSEPYLLEVVRYIHANPEKAGMCPMAKYRWSSYGEFLSGSGITDTSFVLDIFGGLSAFKKFHREAATTPLVTEHGSVRTLTDEQARELAAEVVGEGRLRKLASLPKEERDDAIRKLLQRGFTIRQLERLSGVGRGIIQRLRSDLAR